MSKECNGLNGLPKALKQEDLDEIIAKTGDNSLLQIRVVRLIEAGKGGGGDGS